MSKSKWNGKVECVLCNHSGRYALGEIYNVVNGGYRR